MTALLSLVVMWGSMFGMDRASISEAEILEFAGKPREALAIMESAVASDPNNPALRAYRSTLYLLLGDFRRGFDEYEWRWKCESYKAAAQSLKAKPWDGSPLPGQTILLYPEQGFGDTFQFVRYAALVKQRCSRVAMRSSKALAPLLRLCPLLDDVIEDGAALPARGGFSTLVGLPRAFGTTLETVPAQVPYLHADQKLVAVWKDFLKRYPSFKVGISWEGSGTMLRRNIPLAAFRPLSKLPSVQLIELQKKEKSDFDKCGAFMDTAAVMMNMDLVITADTSIAHLAGALGRPTWVCLPFAPEWRWMLEREDSPWYPSMRLFRQKVAGDWNGVFERIASELRLLV